MADIYSQSNLYKILELTKKEFDEKLKEFDFTPKQVSEFLTNYENIEYTNNNINKYIELLVFFQYKILDEFIEYILNKYILNCKLLEVITNAYVISFITTAFTNINNIQWESDKQIIYISKYIKITKLYLFCNKNITNDGIKHLIQIEDLNLGHNNTITDEGICDMINITKLNLSNNTTITNKGIQKMNQMVELDLHNNNQITDDGLQNMNQIKILIISSNNNITDKCVIKLTNLHTLNLWMNTKITDYCLMNLTNQLIELNLCENYNITDEGITHMIHMQKLNLLCNNKITNNGIKHMHVMKSLNLSIMLNDYFNRIITDDGIVH